MTQRIVVTGASGQLGSYLLRELRRQDRTVIAWSGSRSGQRFGCELRPVELADRAALVRAFRQARPSVVIHAGAISRIDLCHQDPQRAQRVNRDATLELAELCRECGARLVYVSTDLVFDGRRGWYREEDAAAPLSIYGATKADAEPRVLAIRGNAVLRVSLLFGSSLGSGATFFDRQIEALSKRNPMRLFADEWRTPLSLASAARGLLAMVDAGYAGLLHLGGPERMTRLEMGQRLAAALGADPSVFIPTRQAEIAAPEPRPHDVSLDSTRFCQLFPHALRDSWEQAMAELRETLQLARPSSTAGRSTPLP